MFTARANPRGDLRRVQSVPRGKVRSPYGHFGRAVRGQCDAFLKTFERYVTEIFRRGFASVWLGRVA